MTEPELLHLLKTLLSKAGKSEDVLNAFGQRDFPKLLFKSIGRDDKLTFQLVKSIYHGLTVKHQELCEKEKAIIREVRSWDKDSISDPLKHLRGCFLESDLTSSLGNR